MPIGAPGKEQFINAIVQLRNLDLIAYIGQVLQTRAEWLSIDEISTRSGFDQAVLNHMNTHLQNNDNWRRRITYNPNKGDIKTLTSDATDVTGTLEKSQAADPTSPGGDEVVRGGGGIISLPWALDGTDPNIPLLSQLQLRAPMGLIILGAIDRHIVAATRLEDRNSTHRITPFASLQLVGGLQEIWSALNDFGGDSNRLPINSGVQRSEEPQGPAAAPNALNETVSGATPAK